MSRRATHPIEIDLLELKVCKPVLQRSQDGSLRVVVGYCVDSESSNGAGGESLSDDRDCESEGAADNTKSARASNCGYGASKAAGGYSVVGAIRQLSEAKFNEKRPTLVRAQAREIKRRQG